MLPTATILFFFFNDTATTEIYTLSLHDALPISIMAASYRLGEMVCRPASRQIATNGMPRQMLAAIRDARALAGTPRKSRSEEHTSELQSQSNLVCRLLLEKKKNKKK